MDPVATVFVDRDGVLNPKPRGYLLSPASLTLLSGASEAVRLLNAAGKQVFVITNQRAVALGLLTLGGLEAIHTMLIDQLRAGGARLNGIYTCTHHVGACTCRKPAPGLLLMAQRDHPAIDFTRSVFVGDSAADMLAGQAVGCQTILIGRGRRRAAELASLQAQGRPPTATALSLLHATCKYLLTA